MGYVAITLVLLVVFTPGCTATEGPASRDLDLTFYPPCASHPPPPDLPEVDGLVLPPSATIFSHTSLGELRQVEGVVSLTPIQAREFYEGHPDLEIVTVEDERVEAEILVTDGTHRTFVKVQITCAGGSNFAATIGAESMADPLPRPAGGLVQQAPSPAAS